MTFVRNQVARKVDRDRDRDDEWLQECYNAARGFFWEAKTVLAAAFLPARKKEITVLRRTHGKARRR